jgi:hypothetical protein
LFSDQLVVFVTFSGDDDDILVGCHLHGCVNRLGPIANDGDMLGPGLLN